MKATETGIGKGREGCRPAGRDHPTAVRDVLRHSLVVLVALAASAPPASSIPPGMASDRAFRPVPGPSPQLETARPPVAASQAARPSAPWVSAVDTTVTIARLQYDGGGDWYANPSSLPNLLAAIRERTGLAVAGREATVTLQDPALRNYPYLYMTGHGNVRFTPGERDALRDYLLDGGFLHADDNYGLDESFRREMAAVFPDRELVEIPPDHPVFDVVYRMEDGLPKVHEHDGEPPRALGIFHDGRLMVFYSYESDLGDGWEDPGVHDDPAAVREAALRMGVNLFLYALAQEVR